MRWSELTEVWISCAGMCDSFLGHAAAILTFSCNRPDFDSPSVFCRLLDSKKGGFFSICPPPDKTYTTKQQYLPSSNILQTRYIGEEGVVDIIDFFPRPLYSRGVDASRTKGMGPYRETVDRQDELKKWLVRRVECLRGSVDLGEFLGDCCYERFSYV